jgi:hypothetical protein
MHIHEAAISLIRRTARISVVAEASRMKLIGSEAPPIGGELAYFRFPKQYSFAEIFP